MNIILLGPPGAGKGTQSKLLEDKLGMQQLSTGDMLRSAKNSDSEMGQIVAGVMARGDLVTDEIVIGLISERLERKEKGASFIFDGFPRTLAQADALEKLLEKKNIQLKVVIEIKVEDEDLIKRVTGRFSCKECGAVYHKDSHKPKIPNKCDHCNGVDVFVQRADDNEEAFKTRLMAYYRDTAPLIGYYHAKGKLNSVGGSSGIDLTHNKIREVLID